MKNNVHALLVLGIVCLGAHAAYLCSASEDPFAEGMMQFLDDDPPSRLVDVVLEREVKAGRANNVDLLLTYGTPSEAGFALALRDAVIAKHPKMIQKLMEFDLASRDPHSFSDEPSRNHALEDALDKAVEENYPEAVDIIASSLPQRMIDRALLHAVNPENENAGMVQTLLKYKPDPMTVERVFEEAYRLGHVETFSVLAPYVSDFEIGKALGSLLGVEAGLYSLFPKMSLSPLQDPEESYVNALLAILPRIKADQINSVLYALSSEEAHTARETRSIPTTTKTDEVLKKLFLRGGVDPALVAGTAFAAEAEKYAEQREQAIQEGLTATLPDDLIRLIRQVGGETAQPRDVRE